jgi:membrane protease YdiL (CAAX protease family)
VIRSPAVDRAGEKEVPADARPDLPDRYRIARDADGTIVTCSEAPTVTVRIRPGVTVTAAAARSATPGSIFLDGAAHGAPFLDAKREVYNLDHHEGCIRAFTLATCEQAMVLLRKGLDLRRRDWTVYANDGDLDTVIAIWVLLNHIRLNDRDAGARTRVMPLVRLQGVIDAQGLELRELSALPPEALAEAHTWIDELRACELALKERGRWHGRDLGEHVADRLRAIDRLVYQAHHFAGLQEIEELARAEISDGSVAVVCRAKTGIYEVERELRRLYGKRLGVVVLETRAGTYSLRQTDLHLPATLETVYAHLNLLDPACMGRAAANRWGGSAEIGGSPRATGTQVTPAQIAEVCRRAFRPPGVLRRTCRAAAAVVGSVAIVLAALAGVLVGQPPEAVAGVPRVLGAQFPLLLLFFSGALLLLRALRAPGVYGFRRPAGFEWCRLLPVFMIGAAAGGAWIPTQGSSGVPGWLDALNPLILPLAAEVLFRGLVQGSLITSFAIQESGGRWFLSWPAAISAVLYAAWGAALRHPAIAVAEPIAAAAHPAIGVLGGLMFGVAAGLARERSGSVVPAIVVHWLCATAVLVAQVGW